MASLVCGPLGEEFAERIDDIAVSVETIEIALLCEEHRGGKSSPLLRLRCSHHPPCSASCGAQNNPCHLDVHCPCLVGAADNSFGSTW